VTNDLVITGRVVVPGAVLDDGWIAVDGPRIAAVGQGTPPPARARHDAPAGALILPGVVDGQTHATSAGGLPGIDATTASALAGGVTTIVDMPYDNPAPLSDRARLADKVAAVAAHARCDVALYATVLPGQDTAEVAALVEGGVCAFKISAFESSPTRFPRIPADRALDLLQALAPTHLPLGLHNEDQEIVRAATARVRAAGGNGLAEHAAARPLAAELSATAAFLELGAASGGHAHVVHFSTADGFDRVAALAALGHRVTGELCVHYLWFDIADPADAALGHRLKVNPPVRSGARDALWNAVAAGRVPFVSSDHSSWPVSAKDTASIHDAGAGVPGLETLLPAFLTGAAARGLNAPVLAARLLAEHPARFFGLWPRKGALAAGADADIAVWAPGAMTWDATRQRDDLRWSPFHGRRFDGRVLRTYLRGRLAFDGATVHATPGTGRFLPRGPGGWFAPPA